MLKPSGPRTPGRDADEANTAPATPHGREQAFCHWRDVPAAGNVGKNDSEDKFPVCFEVNKNQKQIHDQNYENISKIDFANVVNVDNEDVFFFLT